MADIKLTVELHQNSMKGLEGKYTGIVSYNGSVSNDDIAEEIAADRTDLRPETVKLVLDAADAVKSKLVRQGFVIVDGMGEYRATVSGVFNGEKAAYDSDLHSLGVAYIPSADLRSGLAQVQVETRPGTNGTIVNAVFDVMSQTQNNLLTPGGPLYIYGTQLRIIGNNETNGVYFVGADGAQHRVSTIGNNTLSTLMIVVPQLSAGQYTLKIITQCGAQGHVKKSVNTYEFDTTLTVE